MTSKQDFTDEEWARIRRAPLVAGVAISLADPGGPIEVAKESVASLRSAILPPSQEELLAAVALDVQALTQQRQNPLGDFRPRGGQQVLEELRGSTSWWRPRPHRRRPRRSAGGWWPRPRRPPTPARRAASWGSAPSR
jgi:hypothetical protein